MISTLVSILLLLVVAYIVYLVLNWVLSLVNLPGPATQIVWLIFAIIVIIALLDTLGIYHVALN